MIFYFEIWVFLLVLPSAFYFTFKRMNFPFLILLIIICVSHSLAVLRDIGLPFTLLYGPSVYLAHEDYEGKTPSFQSTAPHLVPFAFLSLVYVGLHTAILATVIDESVLNFYYNIYFLAMPVSLCSYGIYCLRRQHKKEELFHNLVDKLGIINIVNALLILYQFIKRFLPLPEMTFDAQWLTLALLLSALTLTAQFLLYNYKQVPKKKISQWKEAPLIPLEHRLKMYKKSLLDLSTLAGHEERLRQYFESSKAYLNPDLSPETVAAHLGISKHHFSQLLNVYIGKTFYQFVAYYRISYAIELIIQQESSLSIEALASDSGFNSKTSFNRYFREFTGFTPSEFKLHTTTPLISTDK